MNSRLGSGWPLSALCAAVAIVAAAPAMAQNTTAAIGGRVTTPEGQPVAGATVTIVHRESGSTNTLLTDAEGRYSARGLRVGGPYTVTVTKGADRTSQDDIYLQLAESLNYDIRLGSQTLQAVVVTGTAASANNKFNSSNAGAGTSLGRQELDAYASIARNLQDYARQDPRLAQTDKERGEISAGGQNSRFNSITVDGVKINDTFGLEANNLPTIKQPISIDAIQSVQVNISNYDVTQQGYTGANINAVTKSGTNDFKGSVYYVFRDDEMTGRRYDRQKGTQFGFLPFTEKTIGATLGGPIIKDKLFFFASYEELKSNRAQPEFGPVGGPLTNVAITQTAIDAATKIAKDKYGIAVGDTNAPAPVTVKDALIKLDWNINENHRANFRYTKTDQDETNFGAFSATGLNLTSWWWNQKKTIETVVGQWFADWTPNFSTELKLSNRDYHSEPQNNSKLPAIGLSFSGPAPAGAPTGVNTGTRFLNFGTELSRQFNVLDTKTVDGYFGANWVLGDHELKAGADYSNNKIYNAFFQNVNGNYTFNCSNTFTYDNVPGIAKGGTMNCSPNTTGWTPAQLTFLASQVEAAVLENFTRGRYSGFQVQIPQKGKTLDDGIAKWSMANTGLFLQDTWTVNNRLTLGVGLRYDRTSVPDAPAQNASVLAAPVVGSVNGSLVTRAKGGFGLNNAITADGRDLAQPRAWFSYVLDDKANQKKQVRGGFGLFQGAAATVWMSNPFSNTGLATGFVGCGNTGFLNCVVGTTTDDGKFNPDPSKQPTTGFGAAAANVDLIDASLRQPSVWKFNLAFDAELPMNLVAGAEWVNTKVKDGLYYQHLNLGAPTRTGTDGRELYYTPAAYNPACWNSTGGTITTGAACATSATNSGVRSRALSNDLYNNVLLATGTNKGGGNAVTLSLGNNKPIYGLNWQVAYTRTSATEVSPLSSSVSNSNFNGRSVFNPNENVDANSIYLVKDRVNASLNWSQALIGKYKTTVGVFYEGRKGKPYSWTYRNDLNGDGVSGNDLMYIPKAPGSGEVVFFGDTASNHSNEDLFWSVVNSSKALRDAKGGVVKRNSAFSPFVNSFDVRVSQEIPGFTAKHKGVLTLDILNFGNLINNRWGRINEINFQSAGGQRRGFVNYVGLDPSGKYIYAVAKNNDGSVNVDDYTQRQVKGESQWAMQITAKYEF
ncbi:TonB-dependent receptor [Roseateles cellulosilyticus]|uniref:TonB-dependent receptor n=1 Tax=Pelomonas cellulosilytica TaxID=2906762 RepID=A0ABS8XQ59_9BURK|nr:TonB-dependent receptor [Pelomonas sp. P8]MCE4554889.1 TonB-dependent receptor [Pelomonas sp. P8]